MYTKKTSLLIGFHGCDKEIRDAVINGETLNPSNNDYDWLGNGIYLWESDPKRAYEWAEAASKRKNSSIKTPAVLGAVIDLGHCLDLMNRESIPFLQLGYDALKKKCELSGTKLPKNENIKDNTDFLLRYLDCAVIQSLHSMIEKNPDSGLMPFDSVRGLFTEGKTVYEGSGFKEKTHIQLCIVNPNCIKGYFIPRELNKNYPAP